MSTVNDARQMLAAGDAERAVRELEQAAGQGECSSWLELGFLFLAGRHVTRDLARARECFFRAGEAGNSSGRRIYIQLLAIGAGAQPNWPEAVNALRDLAASDALAARQMELLGRMGLASNGDPAREIPSRELSAEPRVWSFDRLFSAEESAYLIERAQPNLEPSVIVDPQTGKMREHPVPTSHNMSFVWVSEDLVIHSLNRRIAAASGTAVSVGEPLQILRYSPAGNFVCTSTRSIPPTTNG